MVMICHCATAFFDIYKDGKSIHESVKDGPLGHFYNTR